VDEDYAGVLLVLMLFFWIRFGFGAEEKMDSLQVGIWAVV
jgi:hypothetical protein